MEMDLQARLKDAGLIVTEQRLTVLAALQSEPDAHLSTEQVYRLVQNRGDSLSYGSVNRILTQFESAGLMRRHHFECGKSVFELNDKPRHDHLFCTTSRDVIDFQDDVLTKRIAAVAEKYNIELVSYDLVLYGEPSSGEQEQ